MKKQAVQAPGGRQAAYSARNRARLIKDAQIVLAEIGPSATIEQIAAHAEVSPTTIYKYFENKDQLFHGRLFDLRGYKSQLSEGLIKDSIGWGKAKLGL